MCLGYVHSLQGVKQRELLEAVLGDAADLLGVVGDLVCDEQRGQVVVLRNGPDAGVILGKHLQWPDPGLVQNFGFRV